MLRLSVFLAVAGIFLPLVAQTHDVPGLRVSPKLDETWRTTVHNSYWFGGDLSRDPAASGPQQHMLDSLMIDRARGLEIDLHSNHSERRFSVYHTSAESYSECRFLDACLDIVRAWHFGNPAHDVLFLHLESKEIFPTPRFFAPDGLTPWDLDKVVGDKLKDSAQSWVYKPKDYLKWCEVNRWPSRGITDITFDQYVGEDLQKATAFCKWPTMDELRGKIIVTLHGSGADNELDVRDYNFAYSRGLRDTLAFTMAGVAGAQGTSDCFDFGVPTDARWGNVCDFNRKTVFMDLQTLAFSDFLPGPFYPDPTAAANLYQSFGYLFRSRDRNNRQGILNARQNMLGGGRWGFNLISGDLPRFNPVNDERYYPQVSFAGGCLLDRITGNPIGTCLQDNMIEPSSAIELQAQATSIVPGVDLKRRTDDLFGVFRPVVTDAAGDFRAHISTRTDEISDRKSNFTGRYGCLMARESLDPGSAFIAICRLKGSK